MSDPTPEQQATIDSPRAIRVRTATGWAELVIQGPPGAAGAPGAPGYPSTVGKLADVLTVTADGAAPTWSPPAPSGASLEYLGDWVAGSYKDGDIVVYNGITYECVRPTTATPAPWSFVPPPVYPPPSYGTSLPASPVDGQEAILVDSVTNPSYQWRFRYNAGSTSAYKWEFVGGTEWISNDETNRTLTGTGYSNAITLGSLLTLTLPRAGDYIVEIGSNYQNSAVGNFGYTWLYYAGSSTGLVLYHQAAVTNSWSAGGARKFKPSGLASGSLMEMRHSSDAGTALFGDRHFTICPVRVS
jgi:hypothetical protein